MPIYVQECDNCAATHEDIRTLSMIEQNPNCPICNGSTHRTLRPHTNTSYVDPVIVYQAPDGSMRFPGMGAGRSVAAYTQLGYTRHEIRGAADMRRFEGQMNKREASIMARKVERRHMMREARESMSRSEIRHGLDQGFMMPELRSIGDGRVERTGRMVRVHLSARGRDMMQAAMRHTDGKPRERTGDPGFHSEVYSNNRSNREVSRGNDGRRHRD